jgi:hypothetical protein
MFNQSHKTKLKETIQSNSTVKKTKLQLIKKGKLSYQTKEKQDINYW